jgi:hypothetical protein
MAIDAGALSRRDGEVREPPEEAWPLAYWWLRGWDDAAAADVPCGGEEG